MAKIAINFLFALLWLFLFSNSVSSGKEIVSPFNGLELDLDEKTLEYSFLIGGHLYGAYSQSVFPSSSLLANIEMINSTGAKFFVSLGDNYRDTDNGHIDNFRNSFSTKLAMPLFTAVGNHDVVDRERYKQEFGKTYYSFVYNRELFVFLDTELDEGNISDEQMVFFQAVMRSAQEDNEIQNIIIFSHQLIWGVDSPAYQVVIEHANAASPKNNFRQEIEPVLVELSNQKAIFWISGDIGSTRSLPLFYHKNQNHDITYIAVGIGDTAKDALLQMNISNSSEVSFKPISLTGREMFPIGHYNPDYWKNYFMGGGSSNSESFVSIYKGKLDRMLRHNYFWAGIAANTIVTGLILMIWRKYKYR